jgi:lipoate-protein ligase A
VICSVDAPALILGSTQGPESADEEMAAALGALVLRRRSGGGAVFVAPAAQVWVDCFLPAGDPLLLADVARSFMWIGSIWKETLTDLLKAASGQVEVVQPGATSSTPLSRLACFAGAGPGEVLLDGRKIVGISQRRDRNGAWFHCLVPLCNTNETLAACLHSAEGASWLQYELDRRAGIVPHRAAAVEQAFTSKLPL